MDNSRLWMKRYMPPFEICPDEHADWLVYARRQIQLGLDDIAAGRIIDGETFLRELKDMRDPA